MGQVAPYNSKRVSDSLVLSFACWSGLVEVGSFVVVDSVVDGVRNVQLDHFLSGSKGKVTVCPLLACELAGSSTFSWRPQ
jgi:hypothetical protein